MVALTHWVCFLFFLTELMFWLPVFVLCFGGLFVCVVSWHSGDRPISSQFWRVHRPTLFLYSYWPISITSEQSKVSERLVLVRLGWFMECSCVLPTTQFAYQRGLGTCDVLLCVSHTLPSAFESGQEARIMQIDFSIACDRVNHQGILYNLCSVGIGGSVLSVSTQFLSDRSQHVMFFFSGVNWLMMYQECPRAMFWSRYCLTFTL